MDNGVVNNGTYNTTITAGGGSNDVFGEQNSYQNNIENPFDAFENNPNDAQRSRRFREDDYRTSNTPITAGGGNNDGFGEQNSSQSEYGNPFDDTETIVDDTETLLNFINVIMRDNTFEKNIVIENGIITIVIVHKTPEGKILYSPYSLKIPEFLLKNNQFIEELKNIENNSIEYKKRSTFGNLSNVSLPKLNFSMFKDYSNEVAAGFETGSNNENNNKKIPQQKQELQPPQPQEQQQQQPSIFRKDTSKVYSNKIAAGFDTESNNENNNKKIPQQQQEPSDFKVAAFGRPIEQAQPLVRKINKGGNRHLKTIHKKHNNHHKTKKSAKKHLSKRKQLKLNKNRKTHHK